MNRHYKALGSIASIFKLIGILIWVVTIIAAFLTLLGGLFTPVTRSVAFYGAPLLASMLSAALTLVGGGIAGLFQYAIGEIIDLLRDIELHLRVQSEAARETAYNTRKSAQALDYMVSQRNQRRTVTSKTTPPPSD